MGYCRKTMLTVKEAECKMVLATGGKESENTTVFSIIELEHFGNRCAVDCRRIFENGIALIFEACQWVDDQLSIDTFRKNYMDAKFVP